VIIKVHVCNFNGHALSSLRWAFQSLVQTMMKFERRFVRQLGLFEDASRVFVERRLAQARVCSEIDSWNNYLDSAFVQTQLVRENNIRRLAAEWLRLCSHYYSLLLHFSKVPVPQRLKSIEPSDSDVIKAVLKRLDEDVDAALEDANRAANAIALRDKGNKGAIEESYSPFYVDYFDKGQRRPRASLWVEATDGSEGSSDEFNLTLLHVQCIYIAFQRFLENMILCNTLWLMERYNDSSPAVDEESAGRIKNQRSRKNESSVMEIAVQIVVNRFFARTVQLLRRWFSNYNFGVRRGQAKKIALLRFCIEHNRRYSQIIDAAMLALGNTISPKPHLDTVFPIRRYFVVLSTALMAEIDCYMARTLQCDFENTMTENSESSSLGKLKLMRQANAGSVEFTNNVPSPTSAFMRRKSSAESESKREFPLLRRLVEGKIVKTLRSNVDELHRLIAKRGTRDIQFLFGLREQIKARLRSSSSTVAQATGSADGKVSTLSTSIELPWSTETSIEGYLVGPIPEIAVRLVTAYCHLVKCAPLSLDLPTCVPINSSQMTLSDAVLGVVLEKKIIYNDGVAKLPFEACMTSGEAIIWNELNGLILSSIERYYQKLSFELTFIVRTLFDEVDSALLILSVASKENIYGADNELPADRTKSADGDKRTDGTKLDESATRDLAADLCVFLCSVANDAYRIAMTHLPETARVLKSQWAARGSDVDVIDKTFNSD
jgi:hypothetical protein